MKYEEYLESNIESLTKFLEIAHDSEDFSTHSIISTRNELEKNTDHTIIMLKILMVLHNIYEQYNIDKCDTNVTELEKLLGSVILFKIDTYNFIKNILEIGKV